LKKQGLTVDQIKAKLQKYCAYQDRCHYEVEKKLDEFFIIPEARDEILISLMQDNFLNEERFARNFARGKFKNNDWGKFKIHGELKKRKISDYLIEISISEEISDDDYNEKIEYLIEKKQKSISFKSDYEKKSKIMNYLQGKGFSYDEFAGFFD
jgi:regulatory protein